MQGRRTASPRATGAVPQSPRGRARRADRRVQAVHARTASAARARDARHAGRDARRAAGVRPVRLLAALAALALPVASAQAYGLSHAQRIRVDKLISQFENSTSKIQYCYVVA